VCDHSDQIWLVSLDNHSVKVFNLQSEFSIKDGDTILGPALPQKIPGQIFVPAYNYGVPEIFSLKQISIESIWKGQSGMGAIQNTSEFGEHFWMALLNGNLVRTSDSGKSWSKISSLPVLPGGYSTLNFVDENNGFYLSEGKVFRTQNGGIVWSKETFTDEVMNMFSNNGSMIICTRKKLFLKSLQDPEWRPVQLSSEIISSISNLVRVSERLYILSGGNLYYTDL
jgi:hypothetical protein